jgi:hypothetical protein
MFSFKRVRHLGPIGLISVAAPAARALDAARCPHRAARTPAGRPLPAVKRKGHLNQVLLRRLCRPLRDTPSPLGVGHYGRKLQTKAGEVRLKVPKLRQQTFETAIIERYRRRESSVEERAFFDDEAVKHYAGLASSPCGRI